MTPIFKNFLALTPAEQRLFIAERRLARLQKLYKLDKKAEKPATVAKIAAALGIAKDEVIHRLEEKLK